MNNLTGDDLDNFVTLTYEDVQVGDLLVEDPERYNPPAFPFVYMVVEKTFGQESRNDEDVPVISVICLKNNEYYRHEIWYDEFQCFLVFSSID